MSLRVLQLHRRNSNINQPDPIDLPGTKATTKEYPWRTHDYSHICSKGCLCCASMGVEALSSVMSQSRNAVKWQVKDRRGWAFWATPSQEQVEGKWRKGIWGETWKGDSIWNVEVYINKLSYKQQEPQQNDGNAHVSYGNSQSSNSQLIFSFNMLLSCTDFLRWYILSLLRSSFKCTVF